jgi:hypothetical protein
MDSDLYYVNGSAPKRLPDWGELFINLGDKLVQLNEEGKRNIIALSVPTRSYAAAFISFGTLISLVEKNRQVSKSSSLEDARFEYLSHLKFGTPLRIRRENKLTHGTFGSLYSSCLYLTISNRVDSTLQLVNIRFVK